MSTKILVRVIFFLILLLTTICFAEANENKFILQKIKAEEGDGSDIKVMLRTGRFAKGVIYDVSAKNVKGDFVQEAPREMIIVSNGLASIITKDQKSLVIGNEFLVDNSLNMAMKGSWNGKKNGAVHMLMGKITIFDYEFESNSNYPLEFKMTGEGYEYLGGLGRVKDSQTGEIYVLVPQEKAINENEYEEDFLDRHACERECCELLVRGQIKEGITIKECVKTLCK